MDLFSFLKEAFHNMQSVDKGAKTGFRFSQKEMNEILSVSKKENLKKVLQLWNLLL